MTYDQMTYEEISVAVENLLEISSDNLDAESIKQQKIFTKLNDMYVQYSRKLYKLIQQKDKVEFNRIRHWTGKMPAAHYKAEPQPDAILKADVPQYMNTDPVVLEIRGLVAESERIVKFLEDSKGSLKSRGFDIKNAIQWRQLMMGQ